MKTISSSSPTRCARSFARNRPKPFSSSIIRRIAPGIIPICTWVSTRCITASAVDIPSVELYWDVPGDPLYQQFVFAFMQAITRERGASVWIQPSEHGISGISSPVEIQLRGLECLPWGVTPEFIESTGREEYYKLHVANIKAREEWLKKSETLPYLAIVASEQTRTLFAQAALPLYFSHTLGAFRALMEKHLPVRVLTEQDLEDANLQGARVLVLPNVACMSDRAAEVVRRFVKAGGGLVATFETSLYDEHFQKRKDFALADLFQASYLGTNTVSQRVENLSLSARESPPDPGRPDHQIQAEHSVAESGKSSGTRDSCIDRECHEGSGRSNASKTLATYNVNLPADQSSHRHPAILISEFGKGRVVYFAAAVDKGMFFYPDAYMRQMLANAVRWAARDVKPLVEVNGPLILTIDRQATTASQANHRSFAKQRKFLGHALDLSEARTPVRGA